MISQPAPSREDPAVEEARRRERETARRQRGRAATILTGDQGDLSAPPVGQKTLLGQ